MRFAIFAVHVSKVLRLPLPRQSDARSYKVLHLSHKIIFPKLKIWCSKMQPFSGNECPDLLTSLMHMSLALRLPRDMHLSSSSSNAHACHRFWTCYKTLTFCSLCRTPLRLPRKTTSEPSKVVRACSVFCILTWKRALRHNDVHFFDISTSKSAPKMLRFVHFDFEMCFAPQRRALFRHLKWSETVNFLHFWLRNVLRVILGCYISPDGSAPAALASLLFDPPEPQIIGKTQCFALPFRAPASSVFWLFLFSDLLSSSLLFSDSPHLCFSISPYCRKFDF